MTRASELVYRVLLLFHIVRHVAVHIIRAIKMPTFVQVGLGSLLRLGFNLKERGLWYRYELGQDTSNLSIIRQSVRIARKIILWTLVLISLSIVLDYILFRILDDAGLHAIGSLQISSTSPQNISAINTAISDLIQIYVGAIAAILGLFLALYIVSFEITTLGYSRDVAEYINNERIGNLFFKWMLTALIFDILVIVRIWLIAEPAIVSLSIATGLSGFALLTVLVYKSHNLLASRPETIYLRILSDYYQELSIVKDKDSWTTRSLTLSYQASTEVRRLINLAYKLYTDLVTKKDTSAATVGPMTTARMLLRYASIRPQLETERTYWFPQEYERISRSDITLFPIATSVSLRGEGTAQQPRRNYYWLEDLLAQVLSKILDQIRQVSESKLQEDLISGIIAAYKRLLFGDYSADRHGRENIKVRGIFELQDLRTFDVLLAQFMSLHEWIAERSQNIVLEYLDALYFVGLVLLDGFNEATMSGASKSLFDRHGYLVKLDSIHRKRFPELTYKVVEDYWLRLEAERVIEGRLVTPKEYAESVVLRSLTDAEKDAVNTRFQKLLEHTNALFSKLTSRQRMFCLKILFAWVKRAYYRERYELLTAFLDIFKREEIMAECVALGVDVIDELDLCSELDDIVLLSLSNREKEVYSLAVQYLIPIYNIKFRAANSPDTFVPLTRSLAKIGSLAFAYSELDQDSFWVRTYTDILFKFFPNKSNVIDAFQQVTSGTNDYLYSSLAASSYFNNWYRTFENELKELPVEYIHRTYSFEEKLKHESDFISSFNAGQYGFLRTEDDCIEGYIKWLKANYPTTNEKEES